MLWLNPSPIPEDLPAAYADYMTHVPLKESPRNFLNKAKARILSSYLQVHYGQSNRTMTTDRMLSSILYCFPGHRVDADATAFGLKAIPGGKLLEIGCGRGTQLSLLGKLGWITEGLDTDATAVAIARQQNPSVHEGDVFSRAYAPGSFDAVVMSHVIEHVTSPLPLLAECHRIMKPHARLAILTPNLESWGHAIYKGNWYPLDPPRHIHLFTPASLMHLCRKAGFHITSCRSTPRSRSVFLASRALASNKNLPVSTTIRWKSRLWMECMENLECMRLFLKPSCGEELHLIATRN